MTPTEKKVLAHLSPRVHHELWQLCRDTGLAPDVIERTAKQLQRRFPVHVQKGLGKQRHFTTLGLSRPLRGQVVKELQAYLDRCLAKS